MCDIGNSTVKAVKAELSCCTPSIVCVCVYFEGKCVRQERGVARGRIHANDEPRLSTLLNMGRI